MDSHGRITVSPEDREREKRAQSLLHEAQQYFASTSRDGEVAIRKYQDVLREVKLHPAIREDILFKLAELHEQAANANDCEDHSSHGSMAEAPRSHLEHALECYMTILGLDERRPAVLARTRLEMGRICRRLGRTPEAVDYLLSARAVANGDELASEELAAGTIKAVGRNALAELASILGDPANRLLRERVLVDHAGDAEIANALAACQSAADMVKPIPPAMGRLEQSVMLVLAAFTIGLVVVMRRGLYCTPAHGIELPAGKERRK
ncbi:MAG TPA: hypothetical protein PLO37_14545 [Candidatus Hydrogenedentes bacterium]|nr:hypothetical protein [Candidatus Hydrogenedentota bacterium]HPG68066.1 hypothetical protein [Candidatus Hydrogenedentota bacterium]